MSHTRQCTVVMARHAYCMLAKRYTGCTVAQIGDLIGRDHSTVVHSIKTSNDLLDVGYQPYAARFAAANEIIKKQKK